MSNIKFAVGVSSATYERIEYILNKERANDNFLTDIFESLSLLGANVFLLTKNNKDVEEINKLNWLPYIIEPFTSIEDVTNVLNYHKEVIEYRYSEFIRLAKVIQQPVFNIDDYNSALDFHKKMLETKYVDERGEFKCFEKIGYSIFVCSEEFTNEIFATNKFNEFKDDPHRASGVLFYTYSRKPKHTPITDMPVPNIPDNIVLKSSPFGDSLLSFDDKSLIARFTSLIEEKERGVNYGFLIANGLNQRERWELEYGKWLKRKNNSFKKSN